MLCSPVTDRQTDTQTDTKVTTEGTLSDFQDFFLQPIIKDRPNKGPFKYIITPRGGEGFLGRCKKGVRKKWGQGGI